MVGLNEFLRLHCVYQTNSTAINTIYIHAFEISLIVWSRLGGLTQTQKFELYNKDMYYLEFVIKIVQHWCLEHIHLLWGTKTRVYHTWLHLLLLFPLHHYRQWCMVTTVSLIHHILTNRFFFLRKQTAFLLIREKYFF